MQDPALHTQSKAMSIRFDSLADLLQFGSNLTNWFYRGQSDVSWGLTTSLERDIGDDDGSAWNRAFAERWMLRTFCGGAPNYLSHLPDLNDKLEWLSLMQHHGASTRLLDFTSSLPIATYFAAEQATTDYVVWAVNWNVLYKAVTDRLKMTLRSDFLALDFHEAIYAKANDFLAGDSRDALVLPVWPRRSSERLLAQQGLFLVPTSLHCRFWENFQSLIPSLCNPRDDSLSMPVLFNSHKLSSTFFNSEYCLLKLVLPMKSQVSVLQSLLDSNIHSGTLFPGIDGFARSMRRYVLRHPRMPEPLP